MSACLQTITFEFSDNNLLHLPETEVYSQLRDLDWDLRGAKTSHSTHGMHSYPAKFIPQIPARLIAALSNPGELVVDLFSGGGTTAVEALRLGRPFVGLDANPISVLLGRVKTTILTIDDRRELQVLLENIREFADACRGAIAEYVPPIPNISKWYSPTVIASLSRIRHQILQLEKSAAKNVALVAFANTAARLSFQDSETRYVSKPRHIDLDEPTEAFITELKRISAIATELDHGRSVHETEFRLGDARQPEAMEIEPRSVGLVVTSPPYPNAYDYHLYHRFRLFWLGADPGDLRRVEIGSHLRHQSEADPAKSYESDMEMVLQNVYDILMPGRYCAMVVGDGIFHGEIYPTSS